MCKLKAHHFDSCCVERELIRSVINAERNQIATFNCLLYYRTFVQILYLFNAYSFILTIVTHVFSDNSMMIKSWPCTPSSLSTLSSCFDISHSFQSLLSARPNIRSIRAWWLAWSPQMAVKLLFSALFSRKYLCRPEICARYLRFWQD